MEKLENNTFYFVVDENYDEQNVESLLKQWHLDDLITIFKMKKIDIETLKFLTLDDICVLIPIEYFSLRVKFRQKLFEWRLENRFSLPLADALFTRTTIPECVHNNISASPPISTITVDSTIDRKSKIIEPNNENFDLKCILNQSIVGKNLLLKENLTSYDRQKLVEIICENWLNNKYYPQHNDIRGTVEQICTIFDKESKEVFIGSKTSRGLLIQKYYALNKKYQAAGLTKSRYNKKTPKNSATHLDIDDNTNDTENWLLDDIINEDIISDYEWLKYNSAPDHLVIEKWNNSFGLRKQHRREIVDMFIEWPILKEQIGSQLISLDFDKEYPAKKSILFKKWNLFLNKIKNTYQMGIKDNASKIIFNNLITDENNSINKDSKDYLYLILLNAIIIPGVIKESGKTIRKPSISDAQKEFVLYVENIIDVSDEICKRIEFSIDKKRQLQPLIVVVGTNIYQIESCYIYYNNIFYKCGTFLNALSLNFQIHNILNIKYARACIQIWYFIETFLFDIEGTGTKSGALVSLLHDLNS